MVFYEVFSHPVLKTYKTTIFSKASIVQLICIVLTFLSPFLVAYFMGGFWIKEKVYSEQPKVFFKYRYLILFSTDSQLYLSSSYSNINQIYQNEYIPCSLTIFEEDTNDDGIYNNLKLNMTFSGIQGAVTNVKIILLFDNSLSTYSNINFESIGFIESSSAGKSSDLAISGELQFFQRNKFKDRNTYDEYNYALMDEMAVELEALQIGKILQAFYDRSYGTRIATDFIFWNSFKSEYFTINVNLRYPPYKILYVPQFWEQFKWGWIQYVAVLIPFFYVFNLIKIFIFENQLVPTIAIWPSNKIKTA